MKKYLYEYIHKIEECINNNDIKVEDVTDHLIKIEFFQHEREIHLLVTLGVAIMAILSFFVAYFIPLFIIIGIILAILLGFYIMHYYYLENGVQKLYKLYDEMKEGIKE